jgi:hypothetical protein
VREEVCFFTIIVFGCGGNGGSPIIHYPLFTLILVNVGIGG